jgi:hypothetical protein
LNAPNGNPTPIPNGYTNYSATANLFVNATPNPAQFITQGNCPWLLPALSAQGFAQADNSNPRGYSGANGWTINFASLQGSFTLNNYYPWADRQPPFSLNGLSVTDRSGAKTGGSIFGLTYSGAGTDPVGTSAEWIQVIRANDASANEKRFGYDAGGGFTYFLDDFWGGNTIANNGTGNPTYDGGYTVNGTTNTSKGYVSNPTTFMDNPASALTNGLDVEFQVFLAKDDAASKTLTIYDGVWWGFTAIPEPGSWLVFVSGCGVAVVFGRRRAVARRRGSLRAGGGACNGRG